MKRLVLLFSLAACAGVVFIWVRSRYVTDVLLYGTSRAFVAQSPYDPCVCLSMLAVQTHEEERERDRFVILFGTLRLGSASERRSEDWDLHRNGLALYRNTTQLIYKPWYFESGWFGHVSWCGFEITRRTGDLVDWRETAVTIPYWMFVALAAAYPLGFLLHTIRNGRRRPGCCPACGYDLRATPLRCPECGLVPIAISA